MRRSSGVLLSYVVRASNKLHLNLSVDNLVTAYVTQDKEMIKRALIIAAINLLGMEDSGPFD